MNGRYRCLPLSHQKSADHPIVAERRLLLDVQRPQTCGGLNGRIVAYYFQEGVLRRYGSLPLREERLFELLAGSKASELDGDVAAAGRQREVNQVPCEVCDPDGLSHIQNVDVP
jgi:hypothetical protein